MDRNGMRSRGKNKRGLGAEAVCGIRYPRRIGNLLAWNCGVGSDIEEKTQGIEML